MTRLRWFALLLVLVFGAVRRPAETAIAASLKKEHFRESNQLPDGPMREKLGQLGAAAALGGFRSFLATLYELRAITAYYDDVDYQSVELNYHMATQLQPREPGYWDSAAWMLATNARRYYLTYDVEHTEVETRALARKSVRRGKKFLDDGIHYNPEDYVLNRALGNHYVNREEAFCEAAEAFGRAATLMEEPNASTRHHAIYLALCSGREREAYGKLRLIAERIQAGKSPIPSHLMPGSVVLHLRYLEGVLGIPEGQRFRSNFDFQALYDRLRARWQPGMTKQFSRLHRLRLYRLEEILQIPVDQRISGRELLRHP